MEMKEALKANKKDVPKVIFKDLNLKLGVARWLSIHWKDPYYGDFRDHGILYHADLFLDTIMREINVPVQFGNMLRLVGIDRDEVCILDNFDERELTFNCHLLNSDTDYKIELTVGNMLDYGPDLIISNESESRTYNYYQPKDTRPSILTLEHFTVKNNKNGNSCFRYFSPYRVSFTLENDDYSLTIDINRPSFKVQRLLPDADVKLKNEDELINYLLGLTFPLDITEVYKRISKISIDSIADYPRFSLLVINKKEDKLTDTITLESGNPVEFIVTKDGMKVKLSSNELRDMKKTLEQDEEIGEEATLPQSNEINHKSIKVKSLTDSTIKK